MGIGESKGESRKVWFVSKAGRRSLSIFFTQAMESAISGFCKHGYEGSRSDSSSRIMLCRAGLIASQNENNIRSKQPVSFGTVFFIIPSP